MMKDIALTLLIAAVLILLIIAFICLYAQR